jgi:hypothetical protein
LDFLLLFFLDVAEWLFKNDEEWSIPRIVSAVITIIGTGLFAYYYWAM